MNTSSGYSILNGTCEISGINCTSYNSTSNGAGTVTNLPATKGWTVHFRVSFGGVGQQYVIKANASTSGYSGRANDGVKKSEETWAATSTAEPAVAAKAK